MEDVDQYTVSSQVLIWLIYLRISVVKSLMLFSDPKNEEPAPWVLLDTVVTDDLSFTPSSKPWFQRECKS
jgi:hypothetical protein